MSYSKGRITGAVSINDVQRALGTGSGDLATLCKSGLINPWAKYRPIPCAEDVNNKPTLITPAQRLAERYGLDQQVDMFTADTIQQYEDYVNNVITKHGLYYIKLRPWGDRHWKRLSDFVNTDANGRLVQNSGYDHNAKPDNKKVTISGGSAEQAGEHYLAPLIPETQRTIYIPAGSTNARYMFPVDHIWMDEYYKKVHGTTTKTVTVEGNDEWLSPMDFMGSNTYSTLGFASVVRRIVIFTWESNKWKFFNFATDKVTHSEAVWNKTDRPFSSWPKAWLDLTDSENAVNTCYNSTDTSMQSHLMKNLSGRCLFVDFWVQEYSSTNVFPILGYAYEVYIDRTKDVNVDVSGVLTFVSVYKQGDGTTSDYVLYVDYDPNKTGWEAGLVNCGTRVVAKLREYYDELSIQIGSVNINLLNALLDYSTTTQGSGDWFRLECVCLENNTSADSATTATVRARRKNVSATSTKVIQISEN